MVGGENYFSSYCCSDSDYSTIDFHSLKKPRVSSSMYFNQERFYISSDCSASSSSKSSVSRILRYPEPSKRFTREIHAPCRTPKFTLSPFLRRESRTKGNVLHEIFLNSRYEQTKSAAIGSETCPQDNIHEIVLNSRYEQTKSTETCSWGNPHGIDLNSRYEQTKSSAFGTETCSRGNPHGIDLNSRYEETKGLAIDTFRHLRKDDNVVIDLETTTDVSSDDSSVEEVEIIEIPAMPAKRPTVYRGAAKVPEKYAQLTDSCRPAPSLSVSDFSDHKLMVEEVEKMMESMSVNHGRDLGKPLYRKLYESAEKRNSKLENLASGIKKILLPKTGKKPEDEYKEPFAPLKCEEEAEVSRAFSHSNRQKILVTHQASNIEITGQMLQCLLPTAWLNDEVINLYFELLKERELREPKKFLKCHFFNTFFYKKLFSGRKVYDFKAVRRWTSQKKIGYSLLECDKIFVPIHQGSHWCLAVINKKDRKFQYLDSLKGIDNEVLEVLARYYVDEVKDKSGEDINVISWKREYVYDLPKQENGWDCGMFMIKYADFYSRGLGLCFQQVNMPYFRRRTAKEILRQKAE